jgi:hypothetical protein
MWAECCFNREGDQWSEAVAALKSCCLANSLTWKVLTEHLTGQGGVKTCPMLLHCLRCWSCSSENIRFTLACHTLRGLRA